MFWPLVGHYWKQLLHHKVQWLSWKKHWSFHRPEILPSFMSQHWTFNSSVVRTFFRDRLKYSRDTNWVWHGPLLYNEIESFLRSCQLKRNEEQVIIQQLSFYTCWGGHFTMKDVLFVLNKSGVRRVTLFWKFLMPKDCRIRFFFLLKSYLRAF